MFNLNPFHSPDATLQHWIMLLIAGLLGFVIGYIGRKNRILELEQKLHRVDTKLEECRESIQKH